jgi:ActR/RegA family two-component response regulator
MGAERKLYMTNWNVLVLEDEFLLATDLVMELEARGVAVSGTAARLSQAMALINRNDFRANAAILDVELIDGSSFPLVEPLTQRGVVIVFCSGYGRGDLPPEYAHFPFVSKPANADDVLEALTTYRQIQTQVDQ